MFTKSEVVDALHQVATKAAIPFREPTTARASFWSLPLLYTRTRPVPVGATWLDYIVITPGVNGAPARHMPIITRWVATGLLDPAITGLEYRMLVDEAILPPNLFSLSPGIERNADRATLTPWPVQPQRIELRLQNTQTFRLQVRHADVVPVKAYASITGWFAPNLSNNNRENFNSSGFVQEESVGTDA
jgi:hypothetical protein